MQSSLRMAKIVSKRRIQISRYFASAQKPASPETQNYDQLDVLRSIDQDESVHNTIAYSLAMATRAGSKFPPLTRPLDSRMKEQLRVSKNQLSPSRSSKIDDEPLPRTLQDALRHSSRAIVVTETSMPFRVLDVNKAWEGLCEYSFVESKGKSLGSLLKGPETDQLAVTALLNQLLHGEDATTVLTNYTKSGRKFRNRLHVGPLYDEAGNMSHFVGLLQEV